MHTRTFRALLNELVRPSGPSFGLQGRALLPKAHGPFPMSSPSAKSSDSTCNFGLLVAGALHPAPLPFLGLRSGSNIIITNPWVLRIISNNPWVSRMILQYSQGVTCDWVLQATFQYSLGVTSNNYHGSSCFC